MKYLLGRFLCLFICLIDLFLICSFSDLKSSKYPINIMHLLHYVSPVFLLALGRLWILSKGVGLDLHHRFHMVPFDWADIQGPQTARGNVLCIPSLPGIKEICII